MITLIGECYERQPDGKFVKTDVTAEGTLAQIVARVHQLFTDKPDNNQSFFAGLSARLWILQDGETLLRWDGFMGLRWYAPAQSVKADELLQELLTETRAISEAN